MNLERLLHAIDNKTEWKRIAQSTANLWSEDGYTIRQGNCKKLHENTFLKDPCSTDLQPALHTLPRSFLAWKLLATVLRSLECFISWTLFCHIRTANLTQHNRQHFQLIFQLFSLRMWRVLEVMASPCKNQPNYWISTVLDQCNCSHGFSVTVTDSIALFFSYS